jgi:acetyltransferase
MTPDACAPTGLAGLPGGTHWLDTFPRQLARTWNLASGEVLAVRPIRHDDDEREGAFVRGLSRESGYQRLLSAGIKITPEWIQRMTHIDYHCHMAFAMTTVNDGVEQFVGVARYVVAPTEASAEFGLVIADAWQRKGLGCRLLGVLIEHAKEAGLREIKGTVLATNRAMLSLVLSFGFSVTAEPGDATVVNIKRNLANSNPHPH